MNGARQLALDCVRPLLEEGHDVLDVCCGDCWLRPHVINAGAVWHGIDHRTPAHKPSHSFYCLDLGRFMVWEDLVNLHDFDLIVSCWGLQHLLDREALAWAHVSGTMFQDSKFVYIGRYLAHTCREMGRDDPLNGYTEESLDGLALANGLVIKSFETYRYDKDKYWPASAVHDQSPNAFCAMMEKIQ